MAVGFNHFSDHIMCSPCEPYRPTVAQRGEEIPLRQPCSLGAGTLHAYLEGADIELMANSDNVLRGGLTPKHVDVPELLATLTFRDGHP